MADADDLASGQDDGQVTEVELPTGPARPAHLVVGLGASAGGLEAYRQFFSTVPVGTGITYVLVQHLAPNHESALASLVSGYTAIPVELAQDGAAVEPDRVYVVPPDTILTMRGGCFELVQPAPPAARRTAVNTFLTSLAEDKGEDAIGIILSGFGSDGALGIAVIKERGGLTLSEAEYDHHAKSGMPERAASGGFVDYVMAAQDMPAKLIEYQKHRTICDSAKGPDGLRRDLPSYLPTICALLHDRLGRDFSQYKTGTLLRRIQRRMHVQQTDQVPDYIDRLRTLPHEAELLFREMLISVTRFFRDPAAFEALEMRVFPELLADRRRDEPVRIWVAGCATGEEAYSMAILLSEAIRRSGGLLSGQIFATDIDARAVEFARAGLYPASIAADLSAERLERYFVRDDGQYRIAKELREMCLFSAHDLVKDPPFSRLDMVSCRNLLIYFDVQLQARVLTTFHYALRAGCILMLGSSESAAAQARLFEPLDKRYRLYARRDAEASVPALSAAAWIESRPAVRRPVVQVPNDIDRRASRAMARYAPAFLVVDRQADILRFSGQTAKYLEPATGVASLNLFSLLHPALRSITRRALNQAASSGGRVVNEAVGIDIGAQQELVTLVVEPLGTGGAEGLSLVVFQDLGPASTDGGIIGPEAETDAQAAATATLERDLRITRERLRDTVEALEATTEELQSSNEEYLSVNEELQSANEELETSKEELQSLNEELQTINAELGQRNDSLVRSSSDLANLFNSTSIATLLVDNQLRIRRFTPGLLDIFKVREGDEGRPITDIVTRLTRDGLGQDVQRVLSSLVPVEREVALSGAETSYMMRVQPYRDLNNVIDGAVITFVDISERKRNEAARSLLAAIVESSQDAIIGHDLDGVVTSWNGGAERLFGVAAGVALGQPLGMLLAHTLPDDWPDMLLLLRRGEQLAEFEHSRVLSDGTIVAVSITMSPVRHVDGDIIGSSMVARDISAHKAAEEKTALLLGELDHRVKNILAIVNAVIGQTLKTSATPEIFATEVEGRVIAIAKAHSLVTESGRGEMPLSTLVRTELAPFDRGDGSIVISGPEFALTPKAGLSVAMAVHELASNAAKYGALSVDDGRLLVSWEIGSDATGAMLTLVWSERNGPEVRPPTRRGFGTTLIERAVRHELRAIVTREFPPAGVVCTLTIPLTAEVGRPS